MAAGTRPPFNGDCPNGYHAPSRAAYGLIAISAPGGSVVIVEANDTSSHKRVSCGSSGTRARAWVASMYAPYTSSPSLSWRICGIATVRAQRTRAFADHHHHTRARATIATAADAVTKAGRWS